MIFFSGEGVIQGNDYATIEIEVPRHFLPRYCSVRPLRSTHPATNGAPHFPWRLRSCKMGDDEVIGGGFPYAESFVDLFSRVAHNLVVPGGSRIVLVVENRSSGSNVFAITFGGAQP